MALEKIRRLHSVSELILAVTNNWCEKHQEKPQFCGATKEARKLFGDALKAGGVILCLAALAKAISKL